MATTKRKRRNPSVLARAITEIGMLRQKQADDQNENERRMSSMHSTILGLPAKQDVTDLRNLIVDDHGNLKLATKEDVDQILTVFKNIKSAASIIGGTSSWFWRLLVGFAMLIAVLTFIFGGFKAAGAYLLTHALGGA